MAKVGKRSFMCTHSYCGPRAPGEGPGLGLGLGGWGGGGGSEVGRGHLRAHTPIAYLGRSPL